MATPSGFDPSRVVTQADRRWCTRFDRSSGFLEGKWDNSTVTMKPVLEHRFEVEGDTARRIFAEIVADLDISTDATCRVYAAIKRALMKPTEPAIRRDSDGSGEAGETQSDAAVGESADPKGDAQSPSSSSPKSQSQSQEDARRQPSENRS